MIALSLSHSNKLGHRGGLVDEKALASALKAGKIKAAVRIGFGCFFCFLLCGCNILCQFVGLLPVLLMY
jgi:hypothetical protein